MSINETMYAYGAAKSSIREIAAYGARRKAEIGEQNVFDFSIGNPSVPAPPQVRAAIEQAAALPPVELHSYTPANGLPFVRSAVADSLVRRFGPNAANADDLYLTCGAAASLSITFHALCVPGDEVIVISPYFPEYRVWIECAGAKCVEALADQKTFQVDVEAVGEAITSRTKAVVINSPNNPVGAIYTRECLEALATVLRDREQELGTTIYLVSDEPYREITYGAKVPWVPAIYENTVVCYSWSKSLSLPGERIGYVLVPNTMPAHKEVYAAICGAGRALGYVCAPAIVQKVVEKCCTLPSDVAAYATNRDILLTGLRGIGYECVEPEGAFYLWVRALEPDAQAFSVRARDNHELLLVPSDSFGMTGWVRISYCVAKETIENSLPAFKALFDEYQG